MTRWKICALAVVVAAVLAGCGNDKNDTKEPPVPQAQPEATASEPPPEVSLPPGAQPGLDDYDGDGAPDPTCTTQDFGGGLILRIPCEIGNANGPEEGTRLVKDSLYRLPSFGAV